MSMKKSTKKITVTAMLTAVSLILSYIEAILPHFFVPGVKVGLANAAVVFAIYSLGVKNAAFVSFVRVVLSAMLFGSTTSFIYSASGAALSLTVMLILRGTKAFSAVGVSVAGGVAHNIGQLIAVAVLMNTDAVIYYLPVLLVSGAAAGALVGFLGGSAAVRLAGVSSDFS